MNYRRIYSELIMRAWRRGTVGGYFENHHIIPKCLGGTDTKDNKVKLTAAEHYIAHLLLMRMHPEHHKLALPVILMSKNIGIGKRNKLVSKARELAATSHRGQKRSQATREKISKAAIRSFKENPDRCLFIADRNRKMVITDEFRKKMSEITKGRPGPMTGKKHKPEAKEKISKSLKGNSFALGMRHTEENKAKFSEQRMGNKNALGLKHTDETKRIMSEKSKAYWAKRRQRNDAIERLELNSWAAVQ